MTQSRKTIEVPPRKLGGIIMPKENSRFVVDTKPTKIGLGDMGIQTDRFLEELQEDIVEVQMGTQTDLLHDSSVIRSRNMPLFVQSKLGVDASTYLPPQDLFNFDDQVKPIVENAVGKIIEQALLETMEEAEFGALRSQYEAYEELRRRELLRIRRLEQRERKLQEEQVALIKNRQSEFKEELAVQKVIGASIFGSCYLGGLIPNIMTVLKNDGYITDPTSACKWFQKMDFLSYLQ